MPEEIPYVLRDNNGNPIPRRDCQNEASSNVVSDPDVDPREVRCGNLEQQQKTP